MIFENDTPVTGVADRRSRIINQTPYSGLGKLPPQACDMEEPVLGALMLEKGALEKVIEFLKPEMLYKDAHGKIYKAIISLYAASEPVDLRTVTNKLRQMGELEMIGGAYYLTELSNHVVSSANIEFHARIIVQKFLQRELIRISTETINAAYEDTTDVLELMEKAEHDIFSLNLSKGSKKGSPIKELVAARRKEYLVPVVNGLTGISSGLADVDRISHGWQKTDLIIIAARPGVGKTAYALQLAKYPALNNGKSVAIFSLEMSEAQLTDRLISSESDILLENILTHNLSDDDHKVLDQKLERLENCQLIIDDTPSLGLFEFRAKCRRLKAQHDIQLIIIDYLQLMNGKIDGSRTNREQDIGNISRTLKSVAKELNVPVIALSQLSRATESRPGASKRPMLSDLRESGNIEQDADVVLFLYRDEYYGIYQDSNHRSTVGKCEVIFAKNRNGKTETATTDFNGAKMRFRDWQWEVKQQAAMNFEIENEKEQDVPF